MPTTTVSGARLRELIDDPEREIAVLDVRSPVERTTGHVARSTGLPLHDLEQGVPALVPRRDTPVVLASGRGVDDEAARILRDLGYSDVSVLEHGLDSWTAAGGRLYPGTNVRSKTLGEWIEERYSTATVTAEVVQQWREEGKDLVILDSRPHAEYVHHHVDGGLDTGGGVELAYRGLQAVRGPDTTIVVNCAGRTRGIVGAQSLINTGIANPVFSLHNGTPAWTWAGGALGHGDGPALDAPAEVGDAVRDWARKTLEHAGAEVIDAARLAGLVDEQRTTYVIDVRRPEEHAAGHVRGSRLVQGGQLVQTTDENLAVLRSRVVLVDTEDLVRSAGTVQWLQFLHDGPVSVLPYDPDAVGPDEVRVPSPTVPLVGPVHLRERLTSNNPPYVVDLRSSGAYAAGHLPGSVHARREHLAEVLADVQGPIVLVGDLSYRPHFAAAGLWRDGTRVEVLEDVAALADLFTVDDPAWAAEPSDVTGPPPFGEERDQWYRDYFAWEYSLVPRSRGDGDFDFEGIEEQDR